MNPSAIVQLTHSEATFTRLADNFVAEIRRRMFVPEHADDDVEAEFAALRTTVDSHYPEFCELFASALIGQLGQERLEGMLPGLGAASAQRYLEAAGQISLELEQNLSRLTEKLVATAQAALASPAGSPAPRSGHPRALTLAQSTGVHDGLNSLARAVTQQVLIRGGKDAADPMLMASSEAQRAQGVVLGSLVGFYARLFIKHVGEPHAAAVVEELEREPLRSYLRARTAMKPVLDRGLNELAVRLARKVL